MRQVACDLLTPDEQYLQAALRDGMGTRKELPMAALDVPDPQLQARVIHLRPAHVGRLVESLQECGQLRPVVTFREINNKLWLADGFHRHEAYRLEGREVIPAYVIEGGYREALKFATMTNRENCLGRTKDDERKAARMLFADQEWFSRTSDMIAGHIGVARQTITKWRAEYCAENHIEPPREFETANGVKRPATHRGVPQVRRRADGVHQAFVDGKKVYLGTDRAAASKKLAEIVKQSAVDKSSRMSLHRMLILRSKLNSLGIPNEALDNSSYSGLGEAVAVDGGLVIVAELSNPASLLAPIARAILNRAKHAQGRTIVVCYDPPQCEALVIAKQLAIEFMTPEEVIASLGSSRLT